jgi:hypothetical protein
MDQHTIALLAGVAAAAIMIIIALFAPGLLQTGDHFSGAKLQFFLWTEAALFAYGFLFTAHALGGMKIPFTPTFPDNLFLLMGLSVTAVSASKAVGQPASLTTHRGLAQFFQDANGKLTLPKVQMLAWTVIAVCAYIYTTLNSYCAFYNATAGTNYPNVDTALLALVGLGQGAFVVNRFIDPESTD